MEPSPERLLKKICIIRAEHLYAKGGMELSRTKYFDHFPLTRREWSLSLSSLSLLHPEICSYGIKLHFLLRTREPAEAAGDFSCFSTPRQVVFNNAEMRFFKNKQLNKRIEKQPLRKREGERMPLQGSVIFRASGSFHEHYLREFVSE